MMLSKRSIPRAATAALVLGGCSSSDRVDDLTASMCRSFERCDPAEFEYYYSSQAECRAELEAEARDALADYADYAGQDCADAFLDYYGCLAAEYSRSCDSDEVEFACTDAYNDFIDVCDIASYYYY